MKTSFALLAGFSALAPLTGVKIGSVANAETAGAFSPPSGPPVLSRTVIRGLSDGKQIVVERSFRVQFAASGNGFVLTGAPIGVKVDVRPVLARMGELERQRSEPGPFPLMIDSRGSIHAANITEAPDQSARGAAQQVGSGLLKSAAVSEQTKREPVQALVVMAGDTRGSPWPVDLFNATDAERHQHRTVALADGSQGEDDVLVRIEKWLPCGMPALFERIIATDLSVTRRVSREVWSLAPATGA